MMRKRTSITLLFTVVIATIALFAYTQAIAGSDCSLAGDPGTCWDFTKGYKLYTGPDFGVIENGWQKWQYFVEKKKRASVNHLLFAIEAQVQVEPHPPTLSNYQELTPPGVRDSATNFGGVRLYQVVRWPPNFPTGLSEVLFFTKPVEFTTVGQAAVKGGAVDDIELGNIVMPAGGQPQIIEQTVYMDRAEDGSAIYVEYTRAGELVEALCCTPEPGDDPATFCFDFPTNFDDCTNEVVNLEDTYFALTPTLAFPENATLTFNGGTPISVHAGQVEFQDLESTIQFGDRGRCRRLSNGTYRCY